MYDDDFVFLDAGTTTTLAMANCLGQSGLHLCHHQRCLCPPSERAGPQGPTWWAAGLLGTEAIVGAGGHCRTGALPTSPWPFWESTALPLRQGCTTPDAEEAALKTRRAEQAYLTYVLADSSKFRQGDGG